MNNIFQFKIELQWQIRHDIVGIVHGNVEGDIEIEIQNQISFRTANNILSEHSFWRTNHLELMVNLKTREYKL